MVKVTIQVNQAQTSVKRVEKKWYEKVLDFVEDVLFGAMLLSWLDDDCDCCDD